MSKLMTDRDVDVCARARALNNEAYKRLPVRMTRGIDIIKLQGATGGKTGTAGTTNGHLDFEELDLFKLKFEKEFNLNQEEIQMLLFNLNLILSKQDRKSVV